MTPSALESRYAITQWTAQPRFTGTPELAAAIVVSILLHIVVGIPMAISFLRNQAARAAASGLQSREVLAPLTDELASPLPQDPLELTAGLDQGDPATMTWIGYTEYQEHLAQLSTIEQAAFTEQVPGVSEAENGSAGTGAPAPAAGVKAPPTPPVDPTELAAADAPAEAREGDDTPSEQDGEAGRTQPIDIPPSDDGELESPTAQDAPREPDAEVGPAGEAAAGETPGEQPEGADEPHEESAKPAEVVEPTPPAQPTPGEPSVPGGSSGGTPAERSDRESDARSIVDVPTNIWKNGKPLAAKGLEVRTRKAVFPLLTRITTSPGNPVCMIEFDRNGRPVRCRVLQSSGYREEIDEPVLDALYRWRAAGQQLSQLGDGETVHFTVRVLLR
ncbi:MAG: hypothetical protein O2819_08175 [Planctomycetota bacterium]|nr:hypothetical protein [Planctomycetota bacterium]MDA1106543.1 hypothetical protein [Planctomycetota bacterium]